MGRFVTGVAVITVRSGAGEPFGTTVNALTSLSLEPARLLVCLDQASETLAVLRGSKRFGVNILAEGQEGLSARFAGRGGSHKFSGVAFDWSAAGLPRLEGTVAHIDCEVESLLDAGDHVIVIGRGVGGGEAVDIEPLVYFRGGYRVLQPGTQVHSVKNASGKRLMERGEVR